MDDLSGFGSGLARSPEGYWSSGESPDISYPEDGHDACLSVEDGSFWFRHRNDVITAVMRRFPPRGTVFDVGGGNGFVSVALSRAGFPVVLVEPRVAGARNALQRGVGTVICSTLDAAAFRDRTIPAVGLFDVLEHVADDVRFLAGLHRLLKPEGRLYLTVPAYRGLWSQEDADAGHYRRYSARSLLDALADAGFTVEYSTAFFWLLPVPILLTRALPSRLGLRRASPERTRREHSAENEIVRSFLSRALSAELKLIGEGRSIPVGSSRLVVARPEPPGARPAPRRGPHP